VQAGSLGLNGGGATAAVPLCSHKVVITNLPPTADNYDDGACMQWTSLTSRSTN